MRRHIVVVDMPLGDGLMATPAVAALRDKVSPEPVIVLHALRGSDVYTRRPDPWTVWDHFPGVEVTWTTSEAADALLALPPGEWVGDADRLCRLDVSRAFEATSGKCHMTYGFAQQLGVGVALRYVYTPHLSDALSSQEWPFDRIESPVVLCPVSNSCGSRQGKPANNMIPWESWERLAVELIGRGRQVAVAAHGEPDRSWPGVAWLNSLPIRKIADLMTQAAAVVSVDTGLAHLACAVGANILWVRGGRFTSETTPGHTAGRFAMIDKPVADVTADDLAFGLRKLRVE